MRVTTVKVIVLILLVLALFSLPSSAKQALIKGKYKIVLSRRTTATAYNSMVGQTDSTPWTTAAGTRCREGVIAANHLPIGTKVIIEGFPNQIFVVEDRMNRRYTNRIDIWFRSYQQALQFGRRTIKYHVLEEA